MNPFSTAQLIQPRQRMYWDAFTMCVIVLSAFEIPYSILVGYGEYTELEFVFDWIYLSIFGFDIFLNAKTVRTESSSGFWSWRVFGGLVLKRWSSSALEVSRARPARVLRTQPEVWRDYLCSGWFVVDVLAALPWAVIAATVMPDTAAAGGAASLTLARMLRLLRLARLIKLMRMTRGFRFLNSIRHVTQAFPALERLLVTIIFLPLLAHIQACLLWSLEHRYAQSGIETYSDALYVIYIMLTTANPPEGELTFMGYGVAVFGVALSLGFVVTAIGNFAALFSSIDSQPRTYRKEVRTGHTLVLGWRPSVFGVIDQLLADDSGVASEVIVIADHDPEEMWHAISENCPHIQPGMIDVIRGPIDSADRLEDLSIRNARRVIVLEYRIHPTSTDSADVRLLKSLLACCQAIERSQHKLQKKAGKRRKNVMDIGHRVPIVGAATSADTAKILEAGIPPELSSGVEIRVIDTQDLLSRVLVQVIHQPALSDVFLDLLAYEGEGDERPVDDPGAEIYAIPVAKEWVGRTYQSCFHQFEPAIVIGFFTRTGKLFLNPIPGSESALRPLKITDSLILIADSLDTVSDQGALREPEPVEVRPIADDAPKAPRTIVMIGPEGSNAELKRSLGYFLPEGSVVYSSTAAVPAEMEGTRILPLPGSETALDSQNGLPLVQLVQAVPDEIWVDCDTVVFTQEWCESGGKDAEILLALHALSSRDMGRSDSPKLIVELIERKYKDLVGLYGDVTVLLPSQIASDLLVQLADAPYRASIFAELLDPAGNEIYLRLVSRYLDDGERQISFDDVTNRARARGEVAIGWLTPSEHRPHLAPLRRETMLSIDTDCRVVVIARD